MEGGGEDQWDIALGRGFGRHAGISRYGDLEIREITEGIERRDKAKWSGAIRLNMGLGFKTNIDIGV